MIKEIKEEWIADLKSNKYVHDHDSYLSITPNSSHVIAYDPIGLLYFVTMRKFFSKRQFRFVPRLEFFAAGLHLRDSASRMLSEIEELTLLTSTQITSIITMSDMKKKSFKDIASYISDMIPDEKCPDIIPARGVFE